MHSPTITQISLLGNVYDLPIVSATGHRPDKIGGYNFEAPQRVWVREQLKCGLIALKPQYCISGMALGVDQDFAFTCIELDIPFIAAIPFDGQELNWPSYSQDFYRELLSYSYCRYIVTRGGYSPHKMHLRNKWMVDNCDILIAVWDGSKGGTGNCVQYAEEVKRPINRINPRHFFR